MLRLTGLPSLDRCPRAEVRRVPGRIELRFLGPDCDQALDIDLGLLGSDEDPETAELRLLARLREIGFEVERLPPEGD
jgi:hypothetical protein